MVPPWQAVDADRHSLKLAMCRHSSVVFLVCISSFLFFVFVFDPLSHAGQNLNCRPWHLLDEKKKTRCHLKSFLAVQNSAASTSDKREDGHGGSRQPPGSQERRRRKKHHGRACRALSTGSTGWRDEIRAALAQQMANGHYSPG